MLEKRNVHTYNVRTCLVFTTYASYYLYNYSGRVVEEIPKKSAFVTEISIYSYLVISGSYGRT